MRKRADTPVARAARHRVVQADFALVVRARPGDVGRPEQRDYRHVEGDGKKPRTAVGRHHQPAAANTGFGQPDGNRLVGQADHARMIGAADDAARDLALARPASYQHGQPFGGCDAPRELGEVFAGPELGGAVRAAGIENDDLIARRQVPFLPHRVGRRFIGRQRGQLQPVRFHLAAQRVSKLQIGVDHRRRQPAPSQARVI